MSVVGFDVGNDNCFIAVVRSGGIETIDNDYSVRLTPSYVAFGERNRFLGVEAKNQAVTNIKNTIYDFKRLMGRRYNDSVVQTQVKRNSYSLVKNGESGTAVEVQYLGNSRVFSLEQITAMLFTHLKALAEKALQMKVRDCVISCPSYFSTAQRQALLISANIAGLKVLRLLNDTAASALNYGIYRQLDVLPPPGEKPRNVVFVDCGQTAIQVSVCAFNKGKIKMLASVADLDLGGRDFDEMLTLHFCEKFKIIYNIDPITNPKAYIRLSFEMEKLKKQMSANSTPLVFNIESFMNIDVSGTMSRAEFEQLCSPLFERIHPLLLKCLKDSGVALNEIQAVELVGGSSRIPAIRKIIENVFGQAPSTTLNQDEAVASGCALQCAMLSPTSRAPECSVIDIQPYSIQLMLEDVGGGVEPKILELFSQGSDIPSAQETTVYVYEDHKKPFTVKTFYGEGIPYSEKKIANFVISGMKFSSNGVCTVNLKFLLNANGMLELISAATLEEEEIKQIANESKTTLSEDEVMELSNSQEEGEEQMEVSHTNNENEPVPKDVKDIGEAIEAQKTRIIETRLKVETVLFAQALELRKQFIDQESKMREEDKREKQRIDAKNSVEEYIYDMKDKLQNHFKDVKEDARNSFLQILTEQETWLYDEGNEAQKDAYVNLLTQLKTSWSSLQESVEKCADIPEK